jgi:hypothetical protein
MSVLDTKNIVSAIVDLAKETTLSRGKVGVSIFKDRDLNINVYIICLEGSVINHIFTIHEIKDKMNTLEYDSIICKSIAGNIEEIIDYIPTVAVNGKYTHIRWNDYPLVCHEDGQVHRIIE